MLNLENLEGGFLFKKMVDCGHGVYKLDLREAAFTDDGTQVPLVRDFEVGQELSEYCGDTVNLYRVNIVDRADAWILIRFKSNHIIGSDE